MNLFQLLQNTKVNKNYLNELFCVKKDWITNADKLLESMDDEQQITMISNYSSIAEKDKLFDKLSEILVASIYFEEKPLFFDDTNGKPDIYLKNSEQYIEVKRLNNSDHEKWALDNLVNSGFMTGNRIISDSSETENSAQYKSQCLIEDALKKFSRNNLNSGKIYLIFSLDKFGKIKNWSESEINFTENITNYWSKRKATNISLIVKNENNLFY